jgi:murein DD-endopeptidase MepM/ murein hydrolase activator NlpD
VRLALAAAMAVTLASGNAIPAQETVAADGTRVVRRVGRVTIAADVRHGYPGGLVSVRLASTARLGSANAILDGRRVPFFPRPGGSRALLPVSALSSPGAATLGVEVLGRRSRQRIPVELLLLPRAYASRGVALAPDQLARARQPEAARDGRRLLEALRGLSSVPLAADLFLPPVTGVTGGGFGDAMTYLGLEGAGAETLFDAVSGGYHHGLDFDVPAGTPVRAPADGRVVLAAPLGPTGLTLVIDHGETVASVLAHLDALDVAAGQSVRAGEVIARSGRSGLTVFPHLHWGTYVHAVPVDPRVFLLGL